jgi:choline dehydrogenase-like flavoprotein
VSANAFDADVIVIGSGPAGVSVAYPLASAGAAVLLVDAADATPAAAECATNGWRRMLGDDLEALVPAYDVSPKLQTPLARSLVAPFQSNCGIETDNFVAIGTHARGGLSRIWGAVVAEFDADDLSGWPISVDDLAPSYRAVIERIGVSGDANDGMGNVYGRSGALLPPLPVGPCAMRMLEQFRAGPRSRDFALGLARNAILTTDRDGRQACDLRKGCLWGCPRHAIYDARFDLATLSRRANLRIVDRAHIVALKRFNDGWQATALDGRTFTARRVALAAGTLSTATLAIPLLPDAPTELCLSSNPVVAMPLLIPSQLGKDRAPNGYTLAQLGYRLCFAASPHDYIIGACYEVDGLPLAPFVARLPLSRRAGHVLLSAIAPALMVATGYFHGKYSENRIRVKRAEAGVSLSIRGSTDASLAAVFPSVSRRLRTAWRSVGALPLPGTTLAAPGTDAHYAGVFRMGDTGPHGTNTFGELNAAPGIHIVDGAVLPTLPPKYPTLTIMANADRIGQFLATSAR